MSTHKGFTLVEMLMVMLFLGILTSAVVWTYSAGLAIWNSGDTRAGLRASAAQAQELTVRALRQATAINALSASSVTFTADLGDGSTSYRAYLYNALDPSPQPPYTQSSYQLRFAKTSVNYGDGMVIAANVPAASTPLFFQSGSLVTMDLTTGTGGQTVHVRTKVAPRNL